jgi:hypothetical protein
VFDSDIIISSSGSLDKFLFSLDNEGIGLVIVFKSENIDLVLGILNLMLNLECRICCASG